MIKHLAPEGVQELQKHLKEQVEDDVITCKVLCIYMHTRDRRKGLEEVIKDENGEETSVSDEILRIIYWMNDILTVNTNDETGKTWIEDYKACGGRNYNLFIDCGEIARSICEKWDLGEKPEWLYDEMRIIASQIIGYAFFEPTIDEMIKWLGEECRDEEKYVDGNDHRYNIVKVGTKALSLVKGDDDEEEPEGEPILIERNGKEFQQAMNTVQNMKTTINELLEKVGNDDIKEFIKRDDEGAVGFFMCGMFTMMMPGEGMNRDAVFEKDDNGNDEPARIAFEMVTQMMLGDKLKSLLTDAKSKEVAFQMFKLGLRYAADGIKKGRLPIDLGKVNMKFKDEEDEKA